MPMIRVEPGPSAPAKKRSIAFATLLALAAGALASCGTVSQRDVSAREWQRSQCNQIIDEKARERCMKRVDEEYGTGR